MSRTIAGSHHRQDVETRVLDIVADLVAELRGAPMPGEVGLDRSLERDLGIGSLERVELAARVEDAFGVALSDQAMMDAETPRAVAAAVVSAGPRPSAAAPAPAALPADRARAAPEKVRTLVDVLRWHAEQGPDRVHVLLRDDEGRDTPITYGALWSGAAAVAAGLAERGIGGGDRVAIMLRTEEAFFPTFFGTLLAGAVPVPMYPPFRLDRIEEYAHRQVGILANSGARLLVTFGAAAPVAARLRSLAPSVRETLTAERLARAGERPTLAEHASDEPALIQYTSGSTGAPKGVLLSHANILANIQAIGTAAGVRDGDIAVSWLPLYHDMGLIGMWLGSLYFGIPIVILSPLTFLARPARWLRAIHAHRATISAAPNFAFELCVRRIGDDELAGLDLSSWRLAFNGAEPVSPETIDRFARRFAPYGFQPDAMCPVYGLAETAVGLTMPPPGRRPRVDRVARSPFTTGAVARAVPPSEPAALCFVGCGRPLPGHEVRVVDTAGRALPERVEGRIEFRGPSVMRGYFGDPEATRAVVRDGWCDSGDLGYLAEGELFITGRRKDLVIKAGRNVYPQEIEELVASVPGVRRGCVAAFGVPDTAQATERLVVVAETRETGDAERERIRAEVVDRVVAAVGLPPDVVVLCAPGGVLKTPSGKVRRSATREAYVGGRLDRQPSVSRQWVTLVLAESRARLARLPRDLAHLGQVAWASGVMALGFPLLWLLVLAARGGEQVDRVVRRWCRVVLRLAGIRLDVRGLAALPARGPVVLAANHASYLDALVLFATIPTDFRFVAKRELTGTPLVGRVIASVGHLTVERMDPTRSVADAERVTAALQGGTSLFFFPEGTFRLAPGLLPFKLGAFVAAARAGCPVVPVALAGTREVLPADAWVPRRGVVTVTIGRAVTPSGSEWRDAVRLRDHVRREIAAMLEALGAS